MHWTKNTLWMLLETAKKDPRNTYERPKKDLDKFELDEQTDGR